MLLYVKAGRCDVTLLCNMLYNNPYAQQLQPAGQASAADSAAAARRGGCQFLGIRLLHDLHLPLHLLLCSWHCATRQPFGLLHALSCPRRAAGSAEWPIARQPPACSGGGRAAGMTADRHSIRGCTVSWPRGAAQMALGWQW